MKFKLLMNYAKKLVTFSLCFAALSLGASSTNFNKHDDEKDQATKGKAVNATLKCSPNPASNILNVELGGDIENAELSICNIYGQELLQYKNISSAIFSVNIESLKEGLYYVSLTNSGSTAKYKIVVRR